VDIEENGALSFLDVLVTLRFGGTLVHAVYLHSPCQALKEFLIHLNGTCQYIKFTVQIEENEALSFLDVLVTRRLDVILVHTVYRQSPKSVHHLAQKWAVLTMLV
jgi:hypothetical protein